MTNYYKVKTESPSELSLNTFHYQEEYKTGLSDFDPHVGQLHDFSGKPVPVDIKTDYSHFEKSQETSLDAFLASMKQSKQRRQVKDLVQHDTADVSDEFSL